MGVRNKKKTCKSNVKDQTVDKKSFINRDPDNVI